MDSLRNKENKITSTSNENYIFNKSDLVEGGKMISIPNEFHMFNRIDIAEVIYDDFKNDFKEEEVSCMFGIKVYTAKFVPKNIVLFRQGDRVVGWMNLENGFCRWFDFY